MLIKFDEKYLTISSEITNYAKREEMEKIQQLCGEIVEVIKSVRERRVVKVLIIYRFLTTTATRSEPYRRTANLGGC